MPKQKKTHSIDELIQWTNTQLARTDSYATIGFKQGCCAALEHVLTSNNRYNGFTFNDSHLDKDIPHDSMAYWSRTYFSR